MSAAPAPVRHATRGWFQCPNSIAENQALLTPAERAVVLIVLRREPGSPISDENWKDWTGLEDRIFHAAVSGLTRKGLVIEGRGKRARYHWSTHAWNEYVRHAPPGKARTEGRALSSGGDRGPEPRMHPSCAKHGCQLSKINESDTAHGVAGNLLQPVAETGEPILTKLQQNAATSPASPEGDDTAKAGKEVGSDPGNLERAWVSALGALRGFFPSIGLVFLLRLLAVLRSRFGKIQDSELAEAVRMAFRNGQTSAGLFLDTVPEALAAIRRRPPAQEIPRGEPPGQFLRRYAADARAAPYFRRLMDLAERTDAAGTTAEILAVVDAAADLRDEMEAAGLPRLGLP